MHILIVDDDEALAHMLSERLQRLESSFTIVTADTAENARRAVQETETAFDALLLDQRLDGSDVDGVTLMQELRRSSPRSDAIIFTGYDDSETGLRAFDAGAYRYLTKPFDLRELYYVLRGLQQSRRVRHERDWLQILTETASETQWATTVTSVANILVHGAQRLGFERARLWLSAEDNQEAEELPQLTGVSQAGNLGLDGFRGLKLPLAGLPYSQQARASGKPEFFIGSPLESELDRLFGRHGFLPPVGEWAELPLFAGESYIGSLELDNASHSCSLSHEQCSLLGLFSKQAATALTRARLQEQSERQARQWRLLSEIGKRVTTEAAQGNLESLLDQIREQAHRQLEMDVGNFMAVLLDEETGFLDFRRHYERGCLQPRHWRAYPAGLIGRTIQTNESLLLSKGTKAYKEEDGIEEYGSPSSCYLGVPLLVNETAIGALVVQDYTNENAYSADHQDLLLAVATQVAGAVQTAYRAEREAERTRQLSTLQQLSAALLPLAQESEEWFWHAVLATVTADYGLGFNRAALFMAEENRCMLHGRMGIGYFDLQRAHQAWERDAQKHLTFNDYLIRLRTGLLRTTPVHEIIAGLSLARDNSENPFFEVLDTGRRLVVSASNIATTLSTEFSEPSQYQDFALLPVRSRDKCLGVLMVDNALNAGPLRPETLDRLEEMLAQAGLTLSQLTQANGSTHQRTAHELVLKISQRVLSEVARRPLKSSLEELCREAQAVTKADCVVIYPLSAEGTGYNIADVTALGLSHIAEFRPASRPRQQGVTAHVSRAGTLVVTDVDRDSQLFGGRLLREGTFIQREKIKAFISVPLRERATGESLGVMYLDFRAAPRQFSEQDVALAEQLSDVAVTLMRIARANQPRETADAATHGSQLELTLLRNVQEEALAPDSSEERVVKALLQNGSRLFPKAKRLIVTLQGWEVSGNEGHAVLRAYVLTPLGQVARMTNPDAELRFIGREFEDTGPLRLENSINIPIRFGRQVVGVLVIEEVTPGIFTDAELVLAERLAMTAALALDNVRRQTQLRAVFEAVRAVTTPSSLENILEAVVTAARQAAPDLDCVTLWYREPEGENLIAGPGWGIHQSSDKDASVAQPDAMVLSIMDHPQVIWAERVSDDPSLRKSGFIRAQGVHSTAAFPLRASNETIGALFFNYRHPHEFTPQEQTLFSIFAEIAAASIRDAQSLEGAEQSRERLARALEVSRAVGTRLDLDAVLREILIELRQQFRDASPYVMLFDQNEDMLELPEVVREFYLTDNPKFRERFRLPLNGSGTSSRVARRSLEAGRTLVENLPDVVVDLDYIPSNLETRSELCAGLVGSGSLLGVLVLKSARSEAFNTADQYLFELVAQQVALAIDRAKQHADQIRFKDTIAGATAWAAEVAHTINNEVGYIRNRAYWLRDEPGMSEDALQYVQEIDVSAERLAGAVRSARAGQATPEAFALDEMLQKRIAQWQSNSCPESVKVEFSVGSPAIMVYAHREQLWRAVRHLLRNAVEAMNGQGTLTLSLTYLDASQAELQVKDTGPGIPAPLQQRILREPISSKGANRGIGLLMARFMIESMGGSIDLLSSPSGCGAVFAIRLPLVNEERREALNVHE